MIDGADQSRLGDGVAGWLAFRLLLDQVIYKADIRDSQKLGYRIERRLPNTEALAVKQTRCSSKTNSASRIRTLAQVNIRQSVNVYRFHSRTTTIFIY